MSQWLRELLDDRVAQNILSAIAGSLVTVIVGAIQKKMARLQYTVTHNRIGVSAQDTAFGNVKLTWQENQVANLYMSVLEVTNSSTEDFSDLELRIYTGNETNMLNERTEVSDSPYIVTYSPAYLARIQVPTGQQPTAEQSNLYWHNREYLVPVLNRGQRLRFHYLATVPGGGEPAVWAATMHKGLKLRFSPKAQLVMGVPVRAAIQSGLVLCIVVLVLVAWLLDSVWIAATISLLAGLFAQLLGAATIRVISAIRRALYH